jgi:hypothetical protein
MLFLDEKEFKTKYKFKKFSLFLVSKRISDLCEKGIRGLSIRHRAIGILRSLQVQGLFSSRLFDIRWIDNQILVE